MKKNIYYLFAMMMVAMLSVGFASCGGDDEAGGTPGGGGGQPPTGKSKIIGCWQSVSFVEYDKSGKPVSTIQSGEVYMRFGNDTGAFYDYYDGQWHAFDSFTYYIKDKSLNMVFGDDDIEVYEIVTLNDDKLVLKENFNGEYGGEPSGGWEISEYKKIGDSALPNLK